MRSWPALLMSSSIVACDGSEGTMLDAAGDTTPHYHTDTDTHDTVDLAYLASATALVNTAIARLARGEE